VVGVIRIDAVWLATIPLDMRAGTDSALARVVQVFGAAHPHTAYLFANRRANRMKVLVHDGIGIWLAARRLHQGHFVWPSGSAADRVSLSNWTHWYWVCLGHALVKAGLLPWFDSAFAIIFGSIGGCSHWHKFMDLGHYYSWSKPLNPYPV
jgi:transposase